MRSFFLFLLLCVAAATASAQHTVRLTIKNEEGLPLPGASAGIDSLNIRSVADSAGMATLTDLPNGSHRVKLQHAGHASKEMVLQVPAATGAVVEIVLSEEEEREDEETEEEVIVMATRTSRSISDIPTRVEIISGEELTEKGNMKPGDIRMLLNESTGIQTQQTSATSYNASIRIQGLDGRYTQLLRDGFPLFSGFSGGLSLMQIAPLDLKQVEVIKGSASTLYGGGAIAGLVNLVSKTPSEKREISFLANATSAMGLDLSAFYSQKFKTTGITVFGSRNSGKAYDPAGIGLTAIPKFERYTINPKFFIYKGRTKANMGVSYITEHRIGGSMAFIKNGSAGFFEKNITDRLTLQGEVQHSINERSSLQGRSGFTNFHRNINMKDHVFQGTQSASYSELNYTHKGTNLLWIAGLNLLTDNFREKAVSTTPRDYNHQTIGVFVQNTWSPSKAFNLETGLRMDHTNQFGSVLLPRLSAMLKPASNLTMRIGGGLGYKQPTIFNEESERIQFRSVRALDQETAINERSAGASFDINYRTHIGDVGFIINQLFFYTKLNRPFVLVNGAWGKSFENANGFIDTRGMETNLRFSYSDLKLFVGYTYADVNSHFDGTKNWFPLTARHRLNNVLMYEKEEKLKIGLEAYYFSPQKLTDGSMGRSYWIMGLMGEKLWEKFSIFLNFENFTDTRQTRFGPIYSGSLDAPVFQDIYAPVDGFVVNGGIKLKL